MQPLRIVITISSFRPLVGGGERQAELQAVALAERGHRVTVLTRRFRADLPETELLEGVQIVRVGGANRWAYTVNMLHWLGQHHHEVDVVHAHQSNSPLAVAAIAHKLWGIPTVCTPMTRDPELNWVSAGGMAILRRGLYRNVQRWIAKSDDIASTLEGFAPRSVDRIPNGVDSGRYVPVDKTSVDLPTVVYVGRLEHPKRLDLLLTAWSGLQRSARLLVVGDGTLRPRWQGQAQEMGLACVEFIGATEDIPGILQHADVFVLPSDAEGMPNALLEAMSCGLACVASAVGAIPELLADGAGVATPPGSAEALAEALDHLLTDDGRRKEMGRLARQRVLEMYSLPAVTERIEHVYHQALAAVRP